MCAQCGESEPDDATPLLHTSSGQRLRVLWGHAMISDALYESVVEACPTQISILPDCMVLTSLPQCGVVAPNFNSDRLRLSSMSPGDCAVWNATHWAYMVNASSDPNYDCCTALNSWKDPIGNVCIYDIMGESFRCTRRIDLGSARMG